jgi:putative ABC transport system ATP-binding protein
VIELRDLRRSFMVGDQPVHALAGVDETIADSEHVAIMGPSGSGKSTLLNLIGCLDRPSSGSYHLDGHEVGQLGDEELTRIRREQIGFVFQFFHLVPRLTAAGNVELPLLFGGVSRAERRRRVDEALASVGLSGRMEHRPAQLSGGERQRVAIARAIVNRPKIVLADEPTGNLDSKSGTQILELLDGLNDDGLTLVVVTHDPNVARRADRVIVMVDGKVARRMKGSELPAIVVT